MGGNASEWRIRCTMQVWTIVWGKTALIASGKAMRGSSNASTRLIRRSDIAISTESSDPNRITPQPPLQRLSQRSP